MKRRTHSPIRFDALLALKEEDDEIQETYDHILRMLVKMIIDPKSWILPRLGK